MLKQFRILLLVIMASFLNGCGCTQIETGEVGVKKNWGEVQPKALSPGLHWYNPFSENVEDFDIKETRVDSETLCYTKDTQTAKIKLAVNVTIDPNKVIELYSKVQHDWANRLLEPALLSGAKDIIGQYNADELIAQREAVRTKVLQHLQNAMSPYGIVITQVAFSNIDFDDAYEKAIEAKVVAVQRAAEAKNKTVEIEENAKQKVIAAEAEAKAIQIKSQAIKENKGLIELNAVEKWDGKLPQYMMGNSVPFIKLDQR